MNTSLPIMTSGQTKYDNHINAGAIIKGKFEFTGSALIEGIIYGDVEGFGKLADCVCISTTGKVLGSIRCSMASITGTVVGNIYAKQISLEANSTVQGDIYYETLGIHANAVINGRLIQQSAQEVSQPVAPLLPAPHGYNAAEQLVVGEYTNYAQEIYMPSRDVSDVTPNFATSAVAQVGSSSSMSSLSTPASTSSYSPKRIWRKK